MNEQGRITDPHALVGMRVTAAERSPDAPNRTFVGVVHELSDGGRSLVLRDVRELHFVGEEGGPTRIITHVQKLIPLAEFDVLLCMEPL
jgi:hypothetical protein